MSNVNIQFTVQDDDGFMTQTGPKRKSTLELQIDEMENIFLNMDAAASNPPQVPTISLPIPTNDTFYPSTPHSYSSNGSYSTGPLLSVPPSPSLTGVEEGPRSLPGNVDWSAVLDSKMAMRDRPPESHSSFHGDEALPEPTSPSCGSMCGDHYDHFATDGSHSSHDGGSSPRIRSVASDFGDLRLNTDILQHDPVNDSSDWISPSMPSPGMLAPGPHHAGIRRWSSAGNPSQVRGGHHRFASQQLPGKQFPSANESAEGMGRGRSLTRAVSAPGSAPPSRRHSPYPTQNVDTVYESQGGGFPSYHQGPVTQDGFGGESVMIVKDVVTPGKIARAAAMRRKNPAPFTCDFCETTFTTKFKRDSHVDAHEGKKDFACSSCGKAFTRKSDCVRHEKNTKKCTPSPISPS